MNSIYKGIIPPMITPLTGRETLDVEGLERLVEHLIDGGVHGLFILGTSGEAPRAWNPIIFGVALTWPASRYSLKPFQ